MTTQTQTTDRVLGRLEANVENLQISVADLKTDVQQTNARIDQTNSKIDRLFYAIVGIGGGIIAALIALILKGL